MNYCELKKCDIANGPGVRVSLFVSGCTNHCEQCFQPETWAFDYGKVFDEEAKEEIFAELAKPHVRGLSLLGGEPMEPKNQAGLLPFIKEVREKFPTKDIWCWSGFRFDDEITKEGAYPHCEHTEEFLKNLDVLVDGRFDIKLKDISLRFRGSRNQRLIDMPKTLEKGEIVIWDDGTGKRKSL